MTAATAVIAVIFTGLAWRETHRQVAAQRELVRTQNRLLDANGRTQLDDRFSRAVTDMDSPDGSAARLAGILTVEGIARDHHEKTEMAIQLLEAEVRSHTRPATTSPCPTTEPSTEVRQILDFLGGPYWRDGGNIRVDLSGLCLVGLDFADLDLSGADFHGADVSQANFGGADLHNTNFEHARLRGARFNRADMREASLDEADVSGADMSEAALGNAVLADSTLTCASLVRSDLSGAQLSSSDLTDADLDQANLTDALLLSTNLHDAWMVETNLARAEMHNADLSGVLRAYVMVTARPC